MADLSDARLDALEKTLRDGFCKNPCNVTVCACATAEDAAEVIAGLRADNFGLAANQCHGGYGSETGDHRCKYQDRIKELEKALKPFAVIQPSTFYAEDGSECEGYSVQLPSATLGMKPDFTGADLAAARKALGSAKNGGISNPSMATRKHVSPATGEI